MERFRSESTDKGECDLTVKVILLGDFDVNKGTLIQALKALPKVDRDVTCLKSIPGMVEMMFRRDEKRVKVKINDTAGQERFRSLTSSYYRGAHGCLLMFDVNKRDTFESLSDWQQELKKYTATEELVTVLVGCIFEKEDRQVPKRTAQEFASYHDIDYDEVNVQHVNTLLTVLQEMVDRIIQKASCSPTMSITITPLHKKMDNARQEKEQVRIRTVCSC